MYDVQYQSGRRGRGRRMILKAIAIIISWFLVGVAINSFSGYLSSKLLAKYYKTGSMEEMEKDLMDRNIADGFSEPTDLDLIVDAIFWPMTQFFAWKGHFRIRQDLIKQSNTRIKHLQ